MIDGREERARSRRPRRFVRCPETAARGLLATPGAIMVFSFALALGVRASYLFFLRESPYFDVPIVDAEWHDAWARDWAEGTWNMGGRAFFRAPLYPFFLSLIYRLFGHDLVAARVVQAIIGASSAAAMSGCGWRIGGRSAALWGGLVSALFGTLVFYDGELLIPCLLVALSSWSLFCLLAPWSRTSLVVGCFLIGLAAIARPNALVLLPLSLLFVYTRVRGGVRARAGVVAAAALAAAIPIGFVTLANFRAEGTLVLVASQGGVNFYAGNNPSATGRTAAIEELRDVSNSWNEFVDAARRAAETERGIPLDSREVSDYWSSKAWRWIADHPRDAVRLNLAKVYYLVNGYETPNNRDLYYDRPFPLNVLVWKSRWFYFPWGIAFPLAVMGAIVGVRDRKTRANIGLAAGWVLLYGLSLVPFFVCARFRMGMVPGVVLLASFALARGSELRRWQVLAAGVPALILANANVYRMSSEDVVRERARRGVVWMRAGDVERGREELRAVLDTPRGEGEAASYLSESAFLLGQSYQREGDEAQALRCFRRSLDLGPTSVGVLVSMANHLAKMGEHGDALRALESAVVLRPNDGAVWVDLGLGYENDGDVEEAVRAYQRSIELGPPGPRAYVRLGLAFQRLERPDSAVAVWRRGALRFPDEYALRFNLALAYAREGRSDSAVAEVKAALEINPGSEEAASLLRLLEGESREGIDPPPRARP